MSDSAPDRPARERALDPHSSFIVQAPAGSGKTELLIQRFLLLLARVERPEEIAAITFTKKAAAQMRQRIFAALSQARRAPRPQQSHKAVTWDLAHAALVRNDTLDWQLESDPGRLRIQTIDALCASLTRQMPVLARFGAQPESVEDASALYIEAARSTLAIFEDARDPAAADVARLLVHLDNNSLQAEQLLAAMLRQRDHWLRKLHGANDREVLEAALAAARVDAVRRARALLPAVLEAPGADEDADAWIAFADALLTRQGEWRKRHALYEDLCDNDPLCAALRRLQRLPPGRYSDEQWQALGAIARLLPRAVAELRVVFASHGQADFVEIAQAALRALESEDGPTDLLLSLDYRLRHLLVDEFQDTSFTQFELLEKLTSGWTPGDGRTLFVVGDPMQSIYRFREAEVGLFLRARQSGIGAVALEPLKLTANFRSRADVISWVNEAFADVMPRREDISAGAVAYSPSEPIHPAGGAGVTVHAFFDDDSEGEARRVVELVAAGLQKAGHDPDRPSTVAILVRSRKHLNEIVPRLKAAGLAFRALEIEALNQRPVVQDLQALTRALSHLADRTAWFSILRAPWCGLTLSDLQRLADPDRTLWECMSDPDVISTLSDDGRQRLSRLRDVLCRCLERRGRVGLRTLVEGAWLALGGPACVESATDLEDAGIFLDDLEQTEEAGSLADPAVHAAGLSDLYAQADLQASERLQIMTIHKAKGLEFDTVIVPGLGAGTMPDQRKLFLWVERTTDLLLAPTNPTGSDRDPIYEFIRSLEREKGEHEEGRLLYVAATRARSELHLLGCAKRDKEGQLRPPPRGALLSRLWPAVAADFFAAKDSVAPPPPGEREWPAAAPTLNRLPAEWTAPMPPPAVQWTVMDENERVGDEIEFSWAGQSARQVGSVVHRWLQHIAEDEMRGWDGPRLERMRGIFANELAIRGIAQPELPAAVGRVVAALQKSLADPRGRWLLGPQREARNELRLTALIGGVLRHLIVDRTFVDEDGRRRIVDYKTSTHEGADVDAFLDREQLRYRGQLALYAAALAGDETTFGPALGLYFPLLGGWREWSD